MRNIETPDPFTKVFKTTVEGNQLTSQTPTGPSRWEEVAATGPRASTDKVEMVDTLAEDEEVLPHQVVEAPARQEVTPIQARAQEMDSIAQDGTRMTRKVTLPCRTWDAYFARTG